MTTLNPTVEGSGDREHHPGQFDASDREQVLSNDDPEDAQIKKLVTGLKRIVVRSFEFEHTGEYLESDLDAVHNQLRDPSWKKVVEIRSKTDDKNGTALVG